MEERSVNKALDKIWNCINQVNFYLNDREPWRVKEEELKKALLQNALRAIYDITESLYAFTPKFYQDMQAVLFKKNNTFYLDPPKEPLFVKL